LLNPELVGENWGWCIRFFIGPVLELVIIYLRRPLAESPRWLMSHGREAEAEKTVDDIEARMRSEGKDLPEVDESKAISVRSHARVGLRAMMKVLFVKYPKRTFTGAVMMVTQLFLYCAIFFTYALVLQNLYQVPVGSTALYFFPFAIGDLAGPLLFWHLFDAWGRRKMIFLTSAVAGAVRAVSAVLFSAGTLNATTQIIFRCVSFFFASAGASAALIFGTNAERQSLEDVAEPLSKVGAGDTGE
jgi:hypothetical protein